MNTVRPQREIVKEQWIKLPLPPQTPKHCVLSYLPSEPPMPLSREMHRSTARACLRVFKNCKPLISDT